MKQYYVDEKIVMWKRTLVEVPDTMTDEQFIDKVKEFDGEAWRFEDEENCSAPEVEYLYETEDNFIEADAETTVEVFDTHLNPIALW